MPTSLCFGGLRVVIYTNDHPPPDVHVIGVGTEAKIALGSEGERPSLHKQGIFETGAEESSRKD